MSYSPSSNRVRSLWQSFVKSSTGSRNATEHKIRAATAKADEAAKAGIARDIQEKSFRTLRAQWQSLLLKEGLTDADWSYITEEEKDAVTTILGELPDDDQDPFPSSSSTSPQMPPPNPMPYPHPLAPSFSSSTRSTNISSASSYAVVSPNELYSEDDGDPFMSPLMASSNDTSDEDEVMIQPVHFYPSRRGGGVVAQNGWSSSESLGASLHNSIESSSEIPLSRPLASGFAQNTYYGRMSSAKQSAAAAAASASASAASLLQSDKEKPTPLPPGPKSKTARQPYIGPHLEDPNEPISEAEDFERFKMQTRMEKIIEFHQAAALAEIRLSFAIYKSRKSQAQDGEHRQQVSPLVLDHQKSMAQLQTAKEEERKTIVKRERSKRRSELRGRPGRSNTLIAPTPGVPLDTNPSWLNGLEGQVSAQLAPQFDIDTLLSQDPNEQESNVQHMFGQFFPESSGADVPSMSSSQHSSTNGHHASSSRPAFRSGQGFSSASMQSGVPGPSGHTRKRRPSDARAKKAAKGKGRPSLFGEDDSSDEPAEDDDDDNDNDDDDDDENPPIARRNPFMDAHASEMLANQLQGDFELQMTMAKFGLLGDAQPTFSHQPPPPAPSSMWNPGSRLMEQSPPPVAPTPSPWMAAKDIRSTATPAPVVPSGWTRKNTIVPTPTPQPTQVVPSNSSSSTSSTSSFRNPFGMGMGMGMTAQTAPSPPPPPPSTIPTPAAKAKGRQFVPAPTPEPQPIWGQPHRKVVVSPPIPAIPTEVPVVPTPTLAPPPQVAKPATPAPTPAPAPAVAPAAAASKKTAKKQRQAAKKGGPAGAAAAASSSVMEESTSTPVNPVQGAAADSTIEDPYSVTEPTADPSSLFSSSISRMGPGMTRARMDSSAGMNGFGFAAWDASGGGDSAATPRPASKIPSHLQHLQQQQQQQQQQQETLLAAPDTPRQNPKKNPNANANHNPMVELFGQPLNKTAMEQLAAAGGSSTIRARGSSVANANGPATKSLWNLFSSESASTPVVATKPPAGGDPWIPGGFDGGTEGGDGGGGWGDDGGGGGGGEVEETSQSFWQPQNRTNSKATAAQKSSPAAQNLRRMPEAPSPAPPPALAPTPPAPTPPAPTAKPATPASQPQAAANKKGKGKKGKGKKVTIEEVPDDDDKNDNVEPLPVDSKVIFVDARGEPDDSPVHHHQQLLESSMTSSVGDEEWSEEKEMPSSFGGASSTAGGSQSDSVFGGGGEQGWGGGAGFGFGWGGGGAANAKPAVAWNQSAATDNESSQGGPIWGRTSTPTSQPKQQTPVWGQMNGKDNSKGKGKMVEAEQQQGSSKVVNPNLKRKPAAGGKWL